MLNLRSLITALTLAITLSPTAYAASSSKVFTVTNTGNGPLTISGAAISGNTSEYALTGNTCASVAAGGNCAMTVRFTPSGGGPRAAAALNFSSNGTSGPTHSFALAGTGGYPESCKALLTAAPGTPSGNYTIDPDGAGAVAPFSAYCDMVTEGGGWTRVNSHVAQTSSLTFGVNDVVSGNSVGSSSCSTVGTNWAVTNPVIAYDKIKIEFTRTTTIMQCSLIYAGSNSAALAGMASDYWSGSAWVSNSTCVWNDYIWAKSAGDVSTNGLRNTWRLLANKSPDGTIRLATLCGYVNDTGAFTATMWLR